MLVAPNLRGDDVADLQAALARIGFDSGRVDGIFGPATARALEDFQHNSGLYVDGVCGAATVRALEVLARQTGSGPGITALRELEALTATARTLSDLRVVVGQFGGLSSLSRQLVQALRQRSATVVASDEPDAAAQAAIGEPLRRHGVHRVRGPDRAALDDPLLRGAAVRVGRWSGARHPDRTPLRRTHARP